MPFQHSSLSDEVTVVGPVTVAQPVSVDDNGGSLTIDNPILSVVGGGVEAAAQRVTIANDSTGLLSVDDNGGSLTVDQATHDNLNCNANIQVGDADVANLNPVPISDAGGSITVDGAVTIQEPLSVDDNGGSLTVDQATHDNLNCNANMQVGDADVGAANLVPVDVANNVETTFDHGSNSAIGLVATQFIAANTPAVLGVEVKAANGNTANVYVGNVDVTAATVDATDGMELGPGESILVRIDNVNKLYGISTASDQRVFWLVV